MSPHEGIHWPQPLQLSKFYMPIIAFRRKNSAHKLREKQAWCSRERAWTNHRSYFFAAGEPRVWKPLHTRKMRLAGNRHRRLEREKQVNNKWKTTTTAAGGEAGENGLQRLGYTWGQQVGRSSTVDAVTLGRPFTAVGGHDTHTPPFVYKSARAVHVQLQKRSCSWSINKSSNKRQNRNLPADVPVTRIEYGFWTSIDLQLRSGSD